MLKKFVVGALAALLLASGASLAVAGNGDDDGDDDGGNVIRLVDRLVSEANLDLGETGDSVGDRFVFSGDLYRGDEKVGQDGGECTAVRSVGGIPIVNCVATLSLPGGQITVQGLVDFSNEGAFTVAVTGGTGRYDEADGEMTVETISDTEDRFTIRLR